MRGYQIGIIVSVVIFVVGIILSILFNSLFLFLFLPIGIGWGFWRGGGKSSSGQYPQQQQMSSAGYPTFCSYCGSQLRQGEVFCPNCGKAVPERVRYGDMR
jgi:hypothetical protein